MYRILHMFRQEEPEVNLEQIIERIRSFGKRLRIGGGGGAFPIIVFAVFIVALVIWMGTGFYTVQPGEQSALRLFGKFSGITEPGLHWYWPSPVGNKTIVNVAEVRRLELGWQAAGYYTTATEAIYWDGRNASGESVSSGVYFYRLQAGDYSQTRKMVILK